MRSGAILVLLLTVPYANADVIFDFSGICQSGDCDPGSVVTAEMHFTDDASLTHRDRLVTADDFVSLVVDYFEPIHRVQVTSRWSPTTETTLILPLEVTIDPSGLLRGLLLRDELKNSFRVNDIDNGGGWEYRQVKTASDGTHVVDLTFVGVEGAFGPRRSVIPEPATALLVVGLGLASFAFVRTQRAVSPGRRGGRGVRGSSG